MKRRSFLAALPAFLSLGWLRRKKPTVIAPAKVSWDNVTEADMSWWAGPKVPIEGSRVGDAVMRMRASMTEEQMQQIQRVYDSMTASFKAEATRRYYRDIPL